MIYTGRRREDMPDHANGLPSDLKRGDYWRTCVQENGKQHGEWWICAPNVHSDTGYGVARIPKHTVIEHDDGTITVMPDQARDGHMNSILVMRGQTQIFHGWIKRGYWSESWEELNREVPG